jgi:hypothetical protein
MGEAGGLAAAEPFRQASIFGNLQPADLQREYQRTLVLPVSDLPLLQPRLGAAQPLQSPPAPPVGVEGQAAMMQTRPLGGQAEEVIFSINAPSAGGGGGAAWGAPGQQGCVGLDAGQGQGPGHVDSMILPPTLPKGALDEPLPLDDYLFGDEIEGDLLEQLESVAFLQGPIDEDLLQAVDVDPPEAGGAGEFASG